MDLLRRYRLMLPLCISSLTLMANAVADTSVWKVSDGKTHLYLAGTMHVLSEKDYPLPPEYNDAYSDSSHLVFETEIGAMESPEFAEQMLKALTYDDGSTLFDKLSPDTTQQLNQYLSSKGVPPESVAPFRPGMLMSMIMMIELQVLGITSEGVDAHFFKKATNDNKTIQPLESMQAQLGFLADMGGEDPNRLVSYTLQEMPRMSKLLNDLRDAWKSGDMESMETFGIEPLLKDYPLLYKQLILDRNNLWMAKIKQMLQDNTVEMVLVGALHLAGDDGLLEQLDKAGYSVVRF